MATKTVTITERSWVRGKIRVVHEIEYSGNRVISRKKWAEVTMRNGKILRLPLDRDYRPDTLKNLDQTLQELYRLSAPITKTAKENSGNTIVEELL